MNIETRQNIAANRAMEHKGNGLLYYVPGFNKTNVCKQIIKSGIYKNILIVVPNSDIKRSWEHNTKDVGDISTIVIDTALRVSKKENIDYYDLVILDEVHRYLSNDLKCLLTSDFHEDAKIIGITGYIPNNGDKSLLLLHLPIIDTISEQEAIANNWISNYREYNLGLVFPDFAKDKYKQLSETITIMMDIFKGCKGDITVNRTPLFKSDMDVIFGCISGVMYENHRFSGEEVRNNLAKRKGWSLDIQSSDNSYAERVDKFWNPVNIKDNATIFTRAIKARNNLLIDNVVKRDAVLEIVKAFDRPTILYNEGIQFAENVALNIEGIRPGKVCIYHSSLESRYILDRTTGEYICYANGKPKKFGAQSLKKLAIEGLKSGRYKILSTVKALDEEIDVPNLSLVIITAGSINPLQQQQRSGKVKTIDLMDTNKNPIVVNLYFKDFILDDEYIRSRDLSKLIQRQATYKNEPIWINSVLEIV